LRRLERSFAAGTSGSLGAAVRIGLEVVGSRLARACIGYQAAHRITAGKLKASIALEDCNNLFVDSQATHILMAAHNLQAAKATNNSSAIVIERQAAGTHLVKPATTISWAAVARLRATNTSVSQPLEVNYITMAAVILSRV
jgi:hypothetical protein